MYQTYSISKNLGGFSGVASQIDCSVRITVITFLPWQIKILRGPPKNAQNSPKKMTLVKNFNEFEKLKHSTKRKTSGIVSKSNFKFWCLGWRLFNIPHVEYWKVSFLSRKEITTDFWTLMLENWILLQKLGHFVKNSMYTTDFN